MNALQRLRRILIGQKQTNIAAPVANPELIPLALGPNGELYARLTGADTPGGATQDVTSGTISGDTVATNRQGADTRSFNYVYNPASLGWDRWAKDAGGNAGVASAAAPLVMSNTRFWDNNGAAWSAPRLNTIGDGKILTLSLYTTAIAHQYNGATLDVLRHPTTFRSGIITAAGSTALWTPATGKKFRVMRYMLELTGNAIQAAAGVVTVTLYDAAAAMNIVHSLYVPGAASNNLGGYNPGWFDLGNGVVSAAANNVLNVNLSAALTGGGLRVTVCGTEE